MTQPLPDARCYTLPDGRCVGNGCMHDSLENQVAAAIADPGSFLPRGDNHQEPVYLWSKRAVMHVIKPYLKDWV